jgi:nicotinate-nucleotide pyrophosphorylase (carboxylating)
MLNCLQRMSGIATLARQAADLVADLPAKVLDTRKTTPNFRMLEKWAVAIGGGTNHRFGLSDMIMLKDNHIDFAGGIRLAILAANAYLAQTGRNLAIEVETQNLAQVEEVLQVGQVDVIMLDNMNTHDMAEAVKMIGGRFKTEASGGVTLENLRQIAQTGVDYVSMGALTHSAKSLDISMKSCAYFDSLAHT